MKSLIQRGIFVAALFAMLAFLVVNRTSANVQSDNTATPETFTLTGDEQALWATVAEELLAQNQQNPAPANQQAAPAQGQSQVATAEQEYKNIQVLKGIPAWQVESLMHLFNTSLGVRCDFCHVREGNRFEFDRDDKQSKKVARKMIQMTM